MNREILLELFTLCLEREFHFQINHTHNFIKISTDFSEDGLIMKTLFDIEITEENLIQTIKTIKTIKDE